MKSCNLRYVGNEPFTVTQRIWCCNFCAVNILYVNIHSLFLISLHLWNMRRQRFCVLECRNVGMWGRFMRPTDGESENHLPIHWLLFLIKSVARRSEYELWGSEKWFPHSIDTWLNVLYGRMCQSDDVHMSVCFGYCLSFCLSHSFYRIPAIVSAWVKCVREYVCDCLVLNYSFVFGRPICWHWIAHWNA